MARAPCHLLRGAVRAEGAVAVLDQREGVNQMAVTVGELLVSEVGAVVRRQPAVPKGGRLIPGARQPAIRDRGVCSTMDRVSDSHTEAT